jgi:signal transduction histidine kinase
MTWRHGRSAVAILAALATLATAAQLLAIEPTERTAHRAATAAAAREAAMVAALARAQAPLPRGAYVTAVPSAVPPGAGVALVGDGRLAVVAPTQAAAAGRDLAWRLVLVAGIGGAAISGWALWAGIARRRERACFAQRQIETVGMVVHDLRGPLTSISLAAARIGRGCALPARTSACTLIERVCERLAVIADDLLTLCTDRSTQLQHAPDDSIGQVLADVAERVRQTHACRVLVDAEPAAGDAPAAADLARAVGNVAENAARHANASVHLRARCSATGVEILIEDDGTGFPDGFEPTSYRRGRRGGRAGLGLSSTRRVVERLGGSLRLGRGAEGGAAISLQVPLRSARR